MDFSTIRFLGFFLLATTISCQKKWENPGLSAGGQSQIRPADPRAQQAAETVRSQVESQIQSLDTYQVLEYTTQVVAGTNWSFKVLVDYNGYQTKIQVAAFQPLGSDQLFLSNVEPVDHLTRVN